MICQRLINLGEEERLSKNMEKTENCMYASDMQLIDWLKLWESSLFESWLKLQANGGKESRGPAEETSTYKRQNCAGKYNSYAKYDYIDKYRK